MCPGAHNKKNGSDAAMIFIASLGDAPYQRSRSNCCMPSVGVSSQDFKGSAFARPFFFW